ncbi:MAG TPA: MerR family transcriptional regulator [Anaerolineaceae bacterium]|nr:MerR family transcriptional regulator [Anaerolineaceae bacterium]
MEDIVRDNRTPLYNIKAVSRLVGLLPVTLRAWERRYGLPQPRRGDQGYRLYSDYDLRTLRWLKAKLNAGMSISRAIEALHDMRSSGQDPANENEMVNYSHPILTENLALELMQSLVMFNDQASQQILRRALSMYSLDDVLSGVVQPALVEIGEAWHRGEVTIAAEHYATQFVLQHLLSLLHAMGPAAHPGVIVAAGAPGEMHQIGILMLVVMLRWRGWEVKYLGPDLKLDRLEEALALIHPRMLLFTATRPEAARNLAELDQVLEKMPAPHPFVVFGGRAFENMRLPESLPAIYLNEPAPQAVRLIENMLREAPFSVQAG